MDYKKYSFAILAIISLNDAVTVNVNGSISFGKEVMDAIIMHSITQYLKPKISESGRRSMPNPETDVLYLIIKSAYLCSDLNFCVGELENFLNEYIMIQTKSIEVILEDILYQNEITNEDTTKVKSFIFEEELKKCLREIRILLRNINLQERENNDAFAWTEVIKRISVMLQTKAISFATERLEGTATDIDEVKKKLTQNFVLASTIVEGKYESKLCADYNICVKAYECTRALKTLFESFIDMNNENGKIFLRHLSEALMETKFYSHLSVVTANELQIILNDMAFSDGIPTKKVFYSMLQTIEGRLSSLASKKHLIKERDEELVHVILSDMDHAYSQRGVDPFHSFMVNFFEWSRSGISLGSQMRTLLKDLTDQLNELSDDLILKLTNEVRVFLELTIGPED